jgi:hypothetical protein
LFTKAIELLGATRDETNASGTFTKPNLELRLGGIHVLNRLARDSTQDHRKIIEILCAYVRENSNSAAVLPQEAISGTKEMGDWLKKVPMPRDDIAAALVVLGKKRPYPFTTVEDRLDLGHCNLQRVDIRAADFSYAWLGFSRLEASNLMETNFRHAILTGANLSEALCDGTRFYGALLFGANLSRARGLNSEQFVLALGDVSTRLPPGIEKPSHWPDKKLTWHQQRRWMREFLEGAIESKTPEWI